MRKIRVTISLPKYFPNPHRSAKVELRMQSGSPKVQTSGFCDKLHLSVIFLPLSITACLGIHWVWSLDYRSQVQGQ